MSWMILEHICHLLKLQEKQVWVCDRFLHLREMEFHSFNLFPGTQLNLQLACSGRSVSKRVLLTMGIRHEPHPCHRLGKGTVIFMVT
ncbi:hypothetical protein ZEAMMB73_Zm00001d021648 [Zea mays]|jgi:hypothetical protein|uniref:Uncharacterized protein n=1 Tax=Zea mays TaxID=4577 RepID=A0A1D6IDH7_MAIZE|nr:hypothetical protein ZEAMMB73_Zm00001d021648 [Zea mays]